MGLNASNAQVIQYTIEKQSHANKLYGINSVYIGDYITAYTIDYTGGTTSNITIPTWCRHMAVILIGGGGGGGYGQGGGGGGGGGGAALASKAISVSPGTTCSITVGFGGIGGSNPVPASGPLSAFAGGFTRLTLNNPSITLTADGGNGGDKGGNGGNGGTVSGSSDYSYYIQKRVNGLNGSIKSNNNGGTGGGRITLNGVDVPVYCADFIASGGGGGSGNGSNPTTGYGGGGGGGGITKSGGNGDNGFARVYFYL
jgi:hypothetical protein